MQTTQQGRSVNKAAEVTKSQEAGECRRHRYTQVRLTLTIRAGKGVVAYVLHSGATGKKLVTVKHLNSSRLQHFHQFELML